MLPKLLVNKASPETILPLREPDSEQYCKFVVTQFGELAENFMTKFPFIQTMEKYKSTFGDKPAQDIIAGYLSNQDSQDPELSGLLACLPNLPLSSSDEILTGLLINTPGFFMYGWETIQEPIEPDSTFYTPPPSPDNFTSWNRDMVEDSDSEHDRYTLEKCRPYVVLMHDYCSKTEFPIKKKRGRPRQNFNRPSNEPSTAIWRSIKAASSQRSSSIPLNRFPLPPSKIQKRGRPRKKKIQYVSESSSSDSSSDSESEYQTSSPIKRNLNFPFSNRAIEAHTPKRGRPRKNKNLLASYHPVTRITHEQDAYIDIMSSKETRTKRYARRPLKECSSTNSKFLTTDSTLTNMKLGKENASELSLSEDELIEVND